MKTKEGVFLSALAAAALFSARTDAQFYGSDAYTEYNLLDPQTHQFRIVYYVTETRAGALYHVNGIRKGSVPSNIEVLDPASGKPLAFERVRGADLLRQGFPGEWDPEMEYIKVRLAREVTQRSEARVRIDKTYLDPESYYEEARQIVYRRRLSIGRNSIVLPPGYGLVSCNTASQAIPLPDGRLRIAFANVNEYPAEVEIRARKSAGTFASSAAIAERAFDPTETLFELLDPGSHEYRIVHDLTAASGKRLPVALLDTERMREISVLDLDRGEELAVEKEGGASYAILAAPIPDGGTVRIRIAGRVSDPSYRAEQGELIWTRTLRGLAGTVVLPPGWELTALDSPATVGVWHDGRAYAHWVSHHPGDLTVGLRARQRAPSPMSLGASRSSRGKVEEP